MKHGMNEKRENLLIAVGLIVLAVIFAGISFWILPNPVATKIATATQPATTMPKLFAVLIPFVLSSIFAVASIENKNSRKLSIIGYILSIILWVIN